METDFSKYGKELPTTPSGGNIDFSKYGSVISQPTNTNTTTQNIPAGTKAENALIPTTGKESILGGSAALLANIPSSAIDFGKNLVQFFNPINTVKTVGQLSSDIAQAKNEGVTVGDVLKEIPTSTYKTIVPTFLQQAASGDFEKARATLQNDPVGQIAPILLTAKGYAEKAGLASEFDNAISKIASPVTKPAAKVAGGAGELAAQTLGAGTGAGASSIKEAVSGSKSFADAMRGKINPDEVVKSVEDAVQNLKDTRQANYLDSLKKIGEDRKAHDISPVINEVKNQLDKFGVKIDENGNLDFSRSSIAKTASARADIQGVYDTIKDWGSQAGDRTGVGLDILKRQLGDFYSDSGQARAFVTGVKNSVSNILNNEVPGYKEMTSSYAKASQFLDDIKSATGVNGKARSDTVFTKLTTALKSDKEFRLEMLKQLQDKSGDPEILSKIAGINMQSWVPKSLIGRGVDVGATLGALGHYLNPQLIPALLLTSPRVVGEFLNTVGMAKNVISPILKTVNELQLPANSQLKQKIADYIENPKMGLSIEDVSKTPKPTDLTSSLAKEAKKYKTAEEFVKAQKDKFVAEQGFEPSSMKVVDDWFQAKQIQPYIGVGGQNPAFFIGKQTLAEMPKNEISKYLEFTPEGKAIYYRGIDKNIKTRGIRWGDFISPNKEKASFYGKVERYELDPKYIHQLGDFEAVYLNPADKLKAPKPVSLSQLTDLWNKVNKKRP